MPWMDYTALNAEDLDALAAYLREGIDPVENRIPATALEEAYIEYAFTIDDEPTDETSSEEGTEGGDDADLILVLVAISIILGLAGVVYAIRREGSTIN